MAVRDFVSDCERLQIPKIGLLHLKTPISLENKLRLALSPCRSRAALVKMEGTENRGKPGKILVSREILRDKILRTRHIRKYLILLG